MVTVVFDGNVLRPDAPLDLTPNTRYVVVIQELKEPPVFCDAWDVRPCDRRNVLNHRQIGRANITIICTVRPKQRRKALHE